MEGPKRLENPSAREPDIDINEEQKQNSIIISNIPKEIQRADLIIYFQKGSNGGGEVNDVIMLEDGKAVVIFDEQEVAERVLTKEHKLKDVLVNLEPYPSTSRDVLPDDIQIFSLVDAKLDPSLFKISASELNEHLTEAEKTIHFKFIETCEGFTISGTLEQIDQACLCLSKYATPRRAKAKAKDKIKGQDESDLDGLAESNLDGHEEEFDLEAVILDVEAKLMYILQNKVRKIEEKYKMIIDLKVKKNKVHLSPKGTDGKLFHDGKEEFISLYQKEFQDLEEKDYSLDGIDKDTDVYKMCKALMDEFNVVIDKREGNMIHIFGNKDHVSRVVQELQTKAGKRKPRRAYKGQVNEELPRPDTYAQRAMSPLSKTLENGVVLSVHQGDITKQHVDVIVNAANERLEHGGGVAGAIIKQGGRQIQQESHALVRQYGCVPVGSVAWTNPGRLPCRSIFHAVGPQWSVHGEAGCRQLIFSACVNSFNIASQQNMCSIAIPGISSGLYGVPVKICAEMMFTAAEQFSCEASNDNQLKDIRFVNIDTPTYEAFRKEFSKRYEMKEAPNAHQSINTNLATHPHEADKDTRAQRIFSGQTNDFDNYKSSGREYGETNAIKNSEDPRIAAAAAAMRRQEEEKENKAKTVETLLNNEDLSKNARSKQNASPSSFAVGFDDRQENIKKGSQRTSKKEKGNAGREKEEMEQERKKNEEMEKERKKTEEMEQDREKKELEQERKKKEKMEKKRKDREEMKQEKIKMEMEQEMKKKEEMEKERKKMEIEQERKKTEEMEQDRKKMEMEEMEKEGKKKEEMEKERKKIEEIEEKKEEMEREKGKEKVQEKMEKKKENAKNPQNEMVKDISKTSSNQQSTTAFFEDGFNIRQEDTERYFEEPKREEINKNKTNDFSTSPKIDDTGGEDVVLSDLFSGLRIHDHQTTEVVEETKATKDSRGGTVDSDADNLTLAELSSQSQEVLNLDRDYITECQEKHNEQNDSEAKNSTPEQKLNTTSVNLSKRQMTYEKSFNLSQSSAKSLKTVGRGRGALLAATMTGEIAKPGHAVRATEVNLTFEPSKESLDDVVRTPPGLKVTKDGLDFAGKAREVSGNVSTNYEESFKKSKKKYNEEEAVEEENHSPSKKTKVEDVVTGIKGEDLKKTDETEKKNQEKGVKLPEDTSRDINDGISKEADLEEPLKAAVRSGMENKDSTGDKEKGPEKTKPVETEKSIKEDQNQFENSNVDGSKLYNKMNGHHFEDPLADANNKQQKVESKGQAGVSEKDSTEKVDRRILNDEKDQIKESISVYSILGVPEQQSSNELAHPETKEGSFSEPVNPKKLSDSNAAREGGNIGCSDQMSLEEGHSNSIVTDEGSENNSGGNNELNEASPEPSSMGSFVVVGNLNDNSPTVKRVSSSSDDSNDSIEIIDKPQSDASFGSLGSKENRSNTPTPGYLESDASSSDTNLQAKNKGYEENVIETKNKGAESTRIDKENTKETPPIAKGESLVNVDDNVPKTEIPEKEATSVLPNKKHQECGCCYNKIDGSQALTTCHSGHVVCRICFDRIQKDGQRTYVCPTCQQDTTCFVPQPPNGQMKSGTTEGSLLGYDGCATIFIDYEFPSGIQGPCHPNPGNPYDELSRRTFLPDNKEGREVLELFKNAFDAGLLFTVGKSKVNDKDNQIIFNADIEHKINVNGGILTSGYPDPDYLKRVKAQLKAKGIE